MKLKTGLLALMALFSMFPLTGCWNYREMNELAFALAMGIDKTNRDNYLFSFQVVNAREIAGEKATGGIPVNVYSGRGKTLLEAIRKASQKVPRRINAQHMRVFVIGEKLAREGIEEVFDLIERDPEPRLTTRVFIAKNTEAVMILKNVTAVEAIPANAILGKIKISGRVLAESYEVEVDDVIRGLITKGGGPVISGIKLVGDPEAGKKNSNVEQTDVPSDLYTSGMALFKKGKLAGWVNGAQARGVSWINNRMKSSIINLDCDDDKDAIAIEILRSRSEIKAVIRGEKPLIRINIQEIASVGETMCPVDLSKSAEMRKLEQQLNKETMHDVMAAVKTAQKLKTDVLGFGEAVDRANPKAWQKMEKEWDRIFPECKVEVQVASTIRRTGMVSKSFLSKEKK
ncbi:Ger(x)C family spore germination protein [Paenibacillus sp. sptzw28]|uniref:Ger(x)C family spore germination protein n=1 Tax=Paenibacillus sp. sptzw28 TaxID=715179 RepID=UPI001C6EDBF8|nr:Ger(x)C family spore germination protein [Paenibacillus sp. sptzw28]QYR22438.1 Ger(x)C family spore germination protein [Paenibacillus sp. sptzw28]